MTEKMKKAGGPKTGMNTMIAAKRAVFGALLISLSACGGGGSGLFGGDSGLGRGSNEQRENNQEGFSRDFESPARANAVRNGDSVFDLFTARDDPNVTVEVNKYLWNASLDILDFMPVEAADPFTGTIVMGPGRPRGGGRAYRATVFITCLLYTSPSPRDRTRSRMPSSA